MAVNRILPNFRPALPLNPTSAQRQPATMPAVWIALIGSAALDVAAQQYLYRVAYEKARQALEPPRQYRQLFSNWN